MTKKEGVSLKYGCSVMHLYKTRPRKEENTSSLPPSVRVRVFFSFLRVRVVLGIHQTTVAFSLGNAVLYRF